MNIYTDPLFDDVTRGRASYGFFGRQGGVSEGIYASLNCGTGSNDDQDAVAENRARIAARLGVGEGGISSLWQCHSAQCLLIDSHVAAGDERPRADALVTDMPGLAIGILTADCGPVLFYGEKKNGAPVIGAAHAGWGGALGGILEDTLSKMDQAGAERSGIIACVGPCIMPPSYEVQESFMPPFLEAHDEAEKFFMPTRKAGHFMFDLPGYIAFRLSLAGVRRVRLMGLDTYKNEEDFFSYRRATHKGENDYGRELSAIVINR